MSRAPLKRPREWQKRLTRERILEATLAIIGEGGEEAVTIAVVADRVGITERTIFRHFESREVLLQSVWERIVDTTSEPRTVDELIASPGRRFRRWDQVPQLARSSVCSQAALEARKAADGPRWAMLVSVRTAMPLLDHATGARRAAIVDLLSSPHAWEVLTQLWGFGVAEAGQAVSEALEVLLGRRAADL